MADQFGVHAVRTFPLLVALGEDLPGAVVVRLDDASVTALLGPEPGIERVGRLAFSLAGVRLKFSVVRDGRRFTLPMSGSGGGWIVKLPDRAFRDVPANEHAMMRWAAAAGVDVPEVELRNGSDLDGVPNSLVGPEEQVFAIRRFDRAAGGRVHVEDFAQIREVAPGKKYENTLLRCRRARHRCARRAGRHPGVRPAARGVHRHRQRGRASQELVHDLPRWAHA